MKNTLSSQKSIILQASLRLKKYYNAKLFKNYIGKFTQKGEFSNV